MQTVDREGYLLGWCQGILLSFENSVGFVVPEHDCIAADEALRQGKKVALTQRGKIISYLDPREDGIFEVKAA
jgi:hypothetical protein